MYVKLIVYIPKEHKEHILKTLFAAGAGKFRNYDSYSFVSEGTTTYRALKDEQQKIGEKGKITTVEEVRIETVCKKTDYLRILEEIKKIHPYEEPAVCVYMLEDISLEL